MGRHWNPSLHLPEDVTQAMETVENYGTKNGGVGIQLITKGEKGVTIEVSLLRLL